MPRFLKFLLAFAGSWLCLTLPLRADKLKKGFERLRIYDYFKAKECFEKSLKKKAAGAGYGLSIIYARHDNPFYNLDSARKYILLSDSAFDLLKPKELNYYAGMGIHDFTIVSQKDDICQLAFMSVAEAGISAISHFISNFGFCPQAEDAIVLRHAAAFRDARKKNTSAAWAEFMRLYPRADERHDASVAYEKALYEELTADRRIASYEAFIQSHPESPYRLQAEKAIYEKSTDAKTVYAYYRFITGYNDNSYVPEAWHELYELYMLNYSEDVIDRFRNEYPDYPFMDELEEDYRLQKALLLPFQTDGLWGYLDENGEVMIAAQYDDASFFSEGLAYVSKEGLYGYIGKSGKKVIPFEYDDAESFKDHTAVVVRDDRAGLINRKNMALLPFEFDEITGPSAGMYIATKNDRSAYFTADGNAVTGFNFDIAGDFINGLAVVAKDGKYGIIESTGHFVITPSFDHLSLFTNGLYKARSSNRWGIIDLPGDTVLEFAYDAIGSFSENRALVARERKCGFIDAKGQVVVPLIFPFSEYNLSQAQYKNGYVLVKQRKGHLLLDTAGIPLKLRGVTDYGLPSEGLIAARLSGKWGYVNQKGGIRIKPAFDGAGAFTNGRAVIAVKNKAGLIDSTGSLVITPRHDRLIPANGFYLAIDNGLYGLINANGQILLESQFDRIEFIENRVAVAFIDERRVYVNLATRKVIYGEGDPP